jgi:hypothetical protein
MNPHWRQFADWQDDPWDGAGLFLGGYAFERQGRRPDFAPVSVDVVEELKAEGSRIDEPRAASEAWRRFRSRLRGERLSIANNPMAPRLTRYVRQRVELTTGKPSVIEIASGLAPTLAAHLRGQLLKSQIGSAHGLLVSINGVGDKIASLFLRDLASYCELSVVTDRHLLQPIDVWVRRAAEQCVNVEADSRSSPADVARAIVEALSWPGQSIVSGERWTTRPPFASWLTST